MANDSENTNYLLRGATLRCTLGTHPRKLNLPKSHGMFVNGEAVANGSDHIGEYDANIIDSEANEHTIGNSMGCNIRMFGVCKSPNNPSKKDNVKFTAYGEDGKELDNPVKGKQCYVQIDGTWEGKKDNLKINDDEAITMGCFLKCRFGGFIFAIADGQDTTSKKKE